ESVARIDPHEVIGPHDKPNMFSRSDRAVANFGFSDNAHWLRVPLRASNGRPSDRIVVVDNPLLRHVDFYLRHGDGRIESLAQRANVGQPTADIRLPPTGQVDLFVRASSRHPLILPLKLYTSAGFTAERERSFMLIGLIIGALGALAAYNLLLSVALRKRSYGWFAVHLLSVGALLLVIQGFGVGFWIDVLGDRGSNFIYATWSLAMFGILTYTSSLLSLPARLPWAAWTMRSFGVLRLALAGLCLVIADASLAKLSVGLLIPEVLAITLCAIVLAVRGSKPAKLLLAAWAVLLAILFAASLLAFGFMPATGYAANGLIVAVLIGAAVISFASVLRYESLNGQVEAATLTATSGLQKNVAERTRSLATTMAALNEANQRLRDANDRDGLTGVYNRRYFDDSIEPMLSRSRTAGQPFSALVADIDHFKRINDNFGHLVGDDCIRLVAFVLQQNVDKAQPVIRYGGEEFVILLPGVPAAVASTMANALRIAVAAQSVKAAKGVVHMTISIGIETIPVGHRQSAAALIEAADKALYAAKDDGRNRVVHAGSLSGSALP
ncbi:MAG: diguanylate cyclase, partial [Dokdonella sp.]